MALKSLGRHVAIRKHDALGARTLSGPVGEFTPSYRWQIFISSKAKKRNVCGAVPPAASFLSQRQLPTFRIPMPGRAPAPGNSRRAVLTFSPRYPLTVLRQGERREETSELASLGYEESLFTHKASDGLPRARASSGNNGDNDDACRASAFRAGPRRGCSEVEQSSGRRKIGAVAGSRIGDGLLIEKYLGKSDWGTAERS
ncbi:hypothetical protein KM043_018399 [Ampulex compressa]|nr:hypothetical protein KM043_018399 [Ampulex compressa]